MMLIIRMEGYPKFWSFFKYPSKLATKEVNAVSADNMLPQSYVLINWPKIYFLHYYHNYSIPDFYKQIPRNWKSIWSSKDGALYRVSELYNQPHAY